MIISYIDNNFVNTLIDEFNNNSISAEDFLNQIKNIKEVELNEIKRKLKNIIAKEKMTMNFTWDDSSDQMGRSNGFVCHIARFYYDNEEIGYLKLIEVKKELVPNLAHYLVHVKGFHGADRFDEKSLKYRNISEDELNIILEKELGENYVNEKVDKLKEDYKKYLDEWSRLTVAFVRVEESYQRSGIATKFYHMIHDYLKEQERGYIYADGCQSKEGKSLWEHFNKNGWVSFDELNLKYFNPY